MNNRFSSITGSIGGEEPLAAQSRSLERELGHVKAVTTALMREALQTWAELWKELKEGVTCGEMVLPEAQRGFTPRCGWPEFLEKMWQMKSYLDSAKRFCEQRS